MREGWTVLPLTEVMTLQRGHDLPAKDRRNGPFPVVAATSTVGYHDQYKVEGPGVVIGRSGSIGGAQWVPGNFWPLNTTLWLKDRKGNDLRFCYYLLKSLDFSHLNVGSGVPTLNRNHLVGESILLPSLDEQRTISEVLSTFDELIDTNAQIIDQTWMLGQAHFERTTEFAELTPLKHIMRLKYGKSLPERARIAGPVPVASSAGITGWHNEALVTGPGVVVGRKGTVGKVTWVQSDFYPIDTCFYVESDYPQIWSYFLTKNAGLESKNSDSAVPGLNREAALECLVPNVGVEIAQQEGKFLEELLGITSHLENENRELIKARDALVPLLLSGKIAVKSAAKLLEDVTK